jgi:hypothetical protein
MTQIPFPADISENFSKKFYCYQNIESGELQNLFWFKAFLEFHLHIDFFF